MAHRLLKNMSDAIMHDDERKAYCLYPENIRYFELSEEETGTLEELLYKLD